MKQGLLLILLIFGIVHFSFAQLSLSFAVKGNYKPGNTHELFESQHNFFPSADFVLEQIPSFAIMEARVLPAFEIGVEGGFKLNKRFNAIFGLNFQQVRLETSTIRNNLGIPNLGTTLSKLYYLKIPLLLEFDVYKDKLFLQAGIYAASKIGYSHKETDRTSSGSLVINTSITGRDLIKINSSDQFNSLLHGFQTGIKYQFWKKLSIDMSYARSFNNLFDEETSLDMHLSYFSFGLQWRFI